MNSIQKIIISAGLFFLLASIFTDGFYHEDEHFQLLEYANFKLGNVPENDLPWEYDEKMRPAFQVFIAYKFIKTLFSLGIHDPFIIVSLLRFFTAIFSLIVLLQFFTLFKNELKEKFHPWLLGLLLLTWYVPFLSVRFSSETYSMLFFILGLNQYKKNKESTLRLFFVGIFLGLSFITRYQIGFMISGFGLWLLFIDKINIKKIILTIAGFTIIFCVGTTIDYWFYGKLVIAPYYYFYQNLVENKAANFGTSPIWDYAIKLPLFVFPFFGAIILPAMIYFFYKKRENSFTWILIPFIFIHHMIGHKEMRFLFPVFPFLPFLILYLIQEVKWFAKIKFLKYPFIGLNFLFLLIMTLKPAYDNIGVFRYIYRHVPSDKVYFFKEEHPFRMYLPEVADQPYRKGIDLSIRFYSQSDFYPHGIVDPTTISSISFENEAYFVVRTKSYDNRWKQFFNQYGLSSKVVYTTYHSYFKWANIGNWMDIKDIGAWSIIEVRKTLK